MTQRKKPAVCSGGPRGGDLRLNVASTTYCTTNTIPCQEPKIEPGETGEPKAPYEIERLRHLAEENRRAGNRAAYWHYRRAFLNLQARQYMAIRKDVSC